MMKVIGLTGGIGAGKSTVSKYLKDKGFLIIDADQISRDLTKIGGEAIPNIRNEFGEKVFFENGELNRKKLAEIVFNDSNKLKVLETFTTDVVNKKIKNTIIELRNLNYQGIVILDVPLLFETGDESLCDETWVVTCSIENKIKRVTKRDNITKEEVINRMGNQLSDIDKEKKATYVIRNDGSLDDLYYQIDNLLLKNI